MATGPGIESAGGPIARLFGEGSASGMDEGELLRRFAVGRDPVALEVLVARHGPMVLGVCRRVLGDRHSSEDAFQATFLVLARKAGSIRDPGRLGPWLHGVAHRVAVRARADLARRNARERPGAEDLAMESTADDPGFDRQELRAALDEEVRRLPEKFRDPIVLCYLDGLTHDEAATRLRCPVGTVRSRLSTGRARLRDRLARRGVAVPSGVFAAALAAEGASAAVSLPLLMATVKAATAFAAGLAGATAAGMVSAGAASLAEGVSTTMILSKLKVTAGLALAGMMTLGLGTVAAYQAGGAGQEPKAEKPSATSKAQVAVPLEPIRTLLEADDPAAASKAQVADAEAKVEIINQRIKQAEATLEFSKLQLVRVRIELEAARARVKELEPDAGGRESAKPKADLKRAGIPDAMAGGMMGPNPFMGGRAGGMDAAGSFPGMGGGMRLNRGPASPLALATLQLNDYVIVHKPKTDRVAAYSGETGEWTYYEVPKGVEVVPIAGPGVMALDVIGDEIGQVATYTPSAGRWFPIELKEPAKGHATPIVGPGQAVYQIGRRVYAFGVTAKSWDVLELPEGANPTPTLQPGRVTVEHDDHLYIFSPKTGKWAGLDAKAGQVATPGPK